MNTIIPSAEELSARLRSMRLAELQSIAKSSGVPYRTLLNIRLGATPNPGIETVRKFFDYLPELAPNEAGTAQAAGQGVANA